MTVIFFSLILSAWVAIHHTHAALLARRLIPISGLVWVLAASPWRGITSAAFLVVTMPFCFTWVTNDHAVASISIGQLGDVFN